MKLLMFNVREFWYKTYEKTLKEVIDTDEEESVKDAIVVFANVAREKIRNKQLAQSEKP